MSALHDPPVKNPRRRGQLPEAPARRNEVQDETTHLWAVSYADFLMVLLCFFILFFSVDESRKESVIERIGRLTLGTETTVGAATGEGRGFAVSGGIGAPGSNKDVLASGSLSHASIASEVKRAVASVDSQVQIEQREERLVLLLPDNIYEKGSVTLSDDLQLKLQEILQKIRPHEKKIHLTFVGHTDSAPVKSRMNSYVIDNFDLSSLRATKALQYAVRLGFSPERMAAKGAAEHTRGTRSLSLIITSKEASL